jgi:DNA polymerase-3 subunit delta'
MLIWLPGYHLCLRRANHDGFCVKLLDQSLTMLFQEVIGQSRIKAKLLRSLQQDKVSNTQLFLGPEGSGTLPLALAFAQYLVCEQPGKADACGQCSACQKVQKLIHPDVHFAFPTVNRKDKREALSDEFIQEWRDAATTNPYLGLYDWLQYIKAGNSQGNISMKECREVLKKLSLKPFEGGKKVMVLWMPELLGKEGNALLKILEEPAPDTYFLLVGEDSEQILNTIMSRTQLVRIPPLSNEAVQEGLQHKTGIGENEARDIAQLADGNFRSALALANSHETAYSSQFIQWMRVCYRKQGVELLNLINQMASKGREEQKNFLSFAIQMLEAMFLMDKGMPSDTRLREEDQDFARKFAGLIDDEGFEALYEGLNQASYYIERNASAKIVLFRLSLRINRILTTSKVLK